VAYLLLPVQVEEHLALVMDLEETLVRWEDKAQVVDPELKPVQEQEGLHLLLEIQARQTMPQS
jgi:hypothetical protein